jgi:hypothetical protein
VNNKFRDHIFRVGLNYRFARGDGGRALLSPGQ